MDVEHDVLVRLRFPQRWQVAQKQRQPCVMTGNSKMFLAGVSFANPACVMQYLPVDECPAGRTLNRGTRSAVTAQTVATLGTLQDRILLPIMPLPLHPYDP